MMSWPRPVSPASGSGAPTWRPTYDEPEFVVRNVWRLYGGWYDGIAEPSEARPLRGVGVGVGRPGRWSAGALARRAERLAGAGETAVACHLIDMAAAVEPASAAVHGDPGRGLLAAPGRAAVDHGSGHLRVDRPRVRRDTPLRAWTRGRPGGRLDMQISIC